MTIAETHAKYVLTPWLAQGGLRAPVIDHGEGSYLVDEEGKRYFDLGSGLIAVNLGHGHPKVVAAIKAQADKIGYSAPGLFNRARAELAEELSKISPWQGEGCRTFFTTAGAEANDDVVRLSRNLTGRNKVLTAYRSFHGSTGTSITLTGEDRRWGGEPGGYGVVRFFAPYKYRSPFYATTDAEEKDRALEHLKRVLVHEDPKRVAAIIVEPVVGSNGVITYPEGYLAGLRSICDEHGIILVFDEVMTGFGRTGHAFAAHTYKVTPDMITFAKGVTSAYLPLGGVMMRESLAKTYDQRALPSGHTYSGHPMSVACGLAAVRAYQEEGLFDRGREIEQWIHAGLEKLAGAHSLIGEYRGVGAFWAIELVKNRTTKEPLVEWHGPGPGAMKTLFGELRSRGVYTFGKYNVAMIAPPLTCKKEELDQAFEALDASLGVLAKSL
jgi:taurine--2-oxoglutarate transaminase